nr:hypothetical protein [Tanacetum cinerariifolium]
MRIFFSSSSDRLAATAWDALASLDERVRTSASKGRDTEMTDALLANVQATQVIKDTHVIMTVVTPEVQQHSSSVSSGFISKMLKLNPNICNDSIVNLNTMSTSLVDVPMNEAVKKVVQLKSDRHRDEAKAENEYFINKIVENIKEQVKVQVKEQVSKILPRIKKFVNEQLEAEVLTR